MEKPLINNREKLSISQVLIDGINRVPVEAAGMMLSQEKEIVSSLARGQVALSDPKHEDEVIGAMLLALHGRLKGFAL